MLPFAALIMSSIILNVFASSPDAISLKPSVQNSQEDLKEFEKKQIKVSLRAATEEDYAYFVTLWPLLQIQQDPASLDNWKSYLCAWTHIITAPDDGEVRPIGIISAYLCEPSKFYLLYFAIEEKYQKRGFGSSALEVFKAQICAKSAKSCLLDCDVKHEQAMAFYRKRGFSKELGHLVHLTVDLKDILKGMEEQKESVNAITIQGLTLADNMEQLGALDRHLGYDNGFLASKATISYEIYAVIEHPGGKDPYSHILNAVVFFFIRDTIYFHAPVQVSLIFMKRAFASFAMQCKETSLIKHFWIRSESDLALLKSLFLASFKPLDEFLNLECDLSQQ